MSPVSKRDATFVARLTNMRPRAEYCWRSSARVASRPPTKHRCAGSRKGYSGGSRPGPGSKNAVCGRAAGRPERAGFPQRSRADPRALGIRREGAGEGAPLLCEDCARSSRPKSSRGRTPGACDRTERGRPGRHGPSRIYIGALAGALAAAAVVYLCLCRAFSRRRPPSHQRCSELGSCFFADGRRQTYRQRLLRHFKSRLPDRIRPLSPALPGDHIFPAYSSLRRQPGFDRRALRTSGLVRWSRIKFSVDRGRRAINGGCEL